MYMPDDIDAIKELQRRLNGIKPPHPYTEAEKAKIMSGRRSQSDIDAGRATINQRDQAIKDAQAQYNALAGQLRQLKNEAAQRFSNWRKSQAGEKQAQYDASGMGMTMNALKAYGPYALGAGAGLAYGSGINALTQGAIDRRAANLKGAASAANALDWNDPAVRDRLRGVVQTGERYLPPEPRRAFVGNALTKALTFGVPAAIGLYESSRYRDLAHDPSATPGEQQNYGMLANALLAGSGELGFHGALGLASPYSAETGADEAAIRGARGALSRADMPAAAPPPEPVQPPVEPPPPAAEPVPAPRAAAEGPVRYRGRPADIAAEMTRDFGLKPGATKAKNTEALLKHIDAAHPEQLRTIAARIPGLDATASTRSLRKSMKAFIGSSLAKSMKRLPGILGPLAGLTAAGAAMAPGDASAGPARGQSITGYRLEKAGMGTPLNALNTASYFTPIGIPRMAWDIGSAGGELARGLYDRATAPGSVIPQDPRFAGMEAAQADEARQRYQMENPGNAIFAPDIGRAIQEDAARRPEMSQAMVQRGIPPEALASYQLMGGGPAVQNELAMTGPDAAFFAALRDFQDHFSQSPR
jgi:hypothetical protein